MRQAVAGGCKSAAVIIATMALLILDYVASMLNAGKGTELVMLAVYACAMAGAAWAGLSLTERR